MGSNEQKAEQKKRVDGFRVMGGSNLFRFFPSSSAREITLSLKDTHFCTHTHTHTNTRVARAEKRHSCHFHNHSTVGVLRSSRS